MSAPTRAETGCRRSQLASGLLVVLLVAACTGTAIDGTGPTGVDRPAINPNQTSREVGEVWIPRVIDVKYRSDPVDVGHPRFEWLDTNSSSFVGGAWYDDDESYMVILLRTTYYHHCAIPSEVWSEFGDATSFGGFYSSSVRDTFACGSEEAPAYRSE